MNMKSLPTCLCVLGDSSSKIHHAEKLLYFTLINPEHMGKDRLKNYNMCYLADALQIYTQKIDRKEQLQCQIAREVPEASLSLISS